MNTRKLSRWMLNLLVGATLLQTTSSCTSTFQDSLVSSLTSSVGTALEDGISSYVNQLLSTNS